MGKFGVPQFNRGSLSKLSKLSPSYNAGLPVFLNSLSESPLIELGLFYDYKEMDIQLILQFEQLRRLRSAMGSEDFLPLIEGLPQLVKLKTPFGCGGVDTLSTYIFEADKSTIQTQVLGEEYN